jgi:tRNA-Thr(GGU) m(6)t(6)A37 methyltransferase TsaA
VICTQVIIEHNLDVIKQADYIIDIGPDGGKNGGAVVFYGTPRDMITNSDTITARCLKASLSGKALTADELESFTKLLEIDISENTMRKMQLMPIGRIVNKEDNTYIALDKKYIPVIEGLDGFSHIQVIWWFDGCDNDNDRQTLYEQNPYKKGPKTLGTFATRSPQRPNPIAVTTAQILWTDKEKAHIGLSYLDAMNGTPVLDIKPYTPSLDRGTALMFPTGASTGQKRLKNPAILTGKTSSISARNSITYYHKNIV